MKKFIAVLLFPFSLLASSGEPSVYKILTEPQWKELKNTGTFLGSPVDLKDGFIHLSGKKQVEGVISRYYANQRPLYVVEFSAKAFGNSLRWEPAANGEKFPHVYGRALEYREVLNSELRN